VDRLGLQCLDIKSQDTNQEEFPVANSTPLGQNEGRLEGEKALDRANSVYGIRVAGN